jgi:aminopeptidase N
MAEYRVYTQEFKYARMYEITRNLLIGTLIVLVGVTTGYSQERLYNIMDSGGPLNPLQAAYNVTFYELDVDVDPVSKSITGSVRVVADAVHPLDQLVLDLDTTFTVQGVYDRAGVRRAFTHENGRLQVSLGKLYQPGSRLDYVVSYSGQPRVAANPPWGGGFTWAQTSDGQPWISVSCQTIGADIWWPVKDHPSDRPDSVGVRITVPKGLVAASNGRLRGIHETDEKTTYNWFMGSPINPYNVSLNVAPYTTLTDTYISVTGDSVETVFWVLPENEEDGKELFPQFIDQMRFFEELVGPFPFRAEKYGIVHTPYLGMEHSTIIAYGAGFRDGALFGEHSDYDDLMHHELAHEWWANLVSVADWKDFWIHEGFGTYMQALFTEQRRGQEAYLNHVRHFRGMIDNRQPVAPHESKSTRDMYQGRDIYYKGASILHTLRYVLGDEQFFTVLRRFAYPDPALELTKDGSALRYSSTEEFRALVESLSGSDMKWFFDVYLHQPELPELRTTLADDNKLQLEWITPDGMPFNMPIEVVVDGEVRRATFTGNKSTVQLSQRNNYSIDPNGWVLKK